MADWFCIRTTLAVDGDVHGRGNRVVVYVAVHMLFLAAKSILNECSSDLSTAVLNVAVGQSYALQHRACIRRYQVWARHGMGHRRQLASKLT